jgi:hypothetical protein
MKSSSKTTLSSNLTNIAAFFGQIATRRMLMPERPAVPANPSNLSAFFVALGTSAAASRRAGLFTDVWEVAQLKRDELRHASVLAWLFNAQAGHGLGDAILQSLLAIIRDRTGRRFPLVFPVSENYLISTELCPNADGTNRVDIAIDGDDFFLFVEVKINAGEGDAQLNRYLEAARRKSEATGKSGYAVIYLTRTRTPRARSDNDRLLDASWRDVSAAILDALKRADIPRNSLNFVLLQQFANRAARL